jgi:hypothetical protein
MVAVEAEALEQVSFTEQGMVRPAKCVAEV